MKKFILTAIAALVMTMPVMADTGVTVYSNNNLVEDKGIIVDGRTLVPVRGVFEYMEYSVEWDNDKKSATLTSKDSETTIILTNGEKTFTVNGTKITPDVPQQIVEGRFMLPLRAVGEAVNADVKWDNDTKTAYISENIENKENQETDVTKSTEVIGNTTITSEINVPFVRIEGINPDETPEEAVEINID